MTLEGPLSSLREDEIRLLTEIAETLGDIDDSSEEDRDRLLDVAQDLRDMFFMVVVIGEFNSGKSTLINALIEDELLPIGITPTTEVIELIRYNETPRRKPNMREDGIREWAHPNIGAEGVAIIDTPGTGSVFRKHEATAKAFLHRSDLVVFVLSAKRAFAETERLYLELVKDYGKKVILVINQMDLLGGAERAEVRRFIEAQVRDLLDLEPLIFTVSAKEALADDPSGGGVEAVRAHLRGVYREAPPARQKLLAQLETAERVVKRHRERLQGKADLITQDTAKVRDVQQELEQQSRGLETQLREASAEIDTVLEGIRRRGINFIDTNLTLRRIGRLPNRDQLQAEFQDVVIGRALRDLNEATNSYVNAVVDYSRQYWRGVINRLNQIQDLMEQELSGLDASVYAEQRESVQQAIRLAEAEMKSYSTGQVVTDIQHIFRTNLNGFATSTAASVAGLVATLLAIAAPGPVLGAGALVTASLAFVIGAPIAAIGGLSAVRYFHKVRTDAKRDFNARIDQLLKTYHEALSELTRKERNRLTQYGNQVLMPVFSRLEVLAQRYARQQSALEQHHEEIEALRKQVKTTV